MCFRTELIPKQFQPRKRRRRFADVVSWSLLTGFDQSLINLSYSAVSLDDQKRASRVPGACRGVLAKTARCL